MVKVINYKVRSKGKIYSVGDIILDLSSSDEKRLIEKGYVEEVLKQEYKNDLSDGKTDNITDTSLFTVDEIKEAVQNINDIEKLNQLLCSEKDSKERKTVVELLEDKISEIEESESKIDE